MKLVRTRAGDTVGLLLYKQLGRDDDEAEQALFDLNPGLAKYGAVLPAGLSITIPDISPPPVRKVVRSWD